MREEISTNPVGRVPFNFKSSARYRAQLKSVGGDHSRILFPPEFSDFSPEVETAADLRRHILNMDHWGVTQLSSKFLSRVVLWKARPLWTELESELGHLHIFQTLKRMALFSLDDCASQFARSGNLLGLQLLFSLNIGKSPSLFALAAGGGHMHLLRFLAKSQCPWDAESCARAAFSGQLETLQWLRANGCPWDASTCSKAVEGGSLVCLRWARENGCPWNAAAFSQAVQGRKLACLGYLVDRSCPSSERDGSAALLLLSEQEKRSRSDREGF